MTSTLSTIATFDDLRRCASVLTNGVAEEEFLFFVKFYKEIMEQLRNSNGEAQRLQTELDIALNNISDLEKKLLHARRMLEVESKSKKEAEHERELMEKKMSAVNDILKNEHEINDETRNKIAGLNTMTRKRKSLAEKHLGEYFGNDINSTGSFLSDLSLLTPSEDDFLNKSIKRFKKHRPSNNKDNSIYKGGRRSHLSVDRKSGNISKHKNIELDVKDKIVAHTRVSVPQGDGPIIAESVIEAIPQDEEVIHNANKIYVNDKKKTAKKSVIKTPIFNPSAPPAEENKTPISSVPKHLFKKHIMRPHSFATKTFLKAETCGHCQKKIQFGKVGIRCRECRVYTHADCKDFLSMACVPQSGGTPAKGGIMGFLNEFSPQIGPRVPALIVHCVNEIETRGLNEVGIYRVSGSDREVKMLKERFLRGKSIPFLGDIDVHVLCGCIKDFLKSIREPLIPTGMWKDFSNAVQNNNSERTAKELYAAVEKLPIANRDTLAFLLQHFQRIAESPEVKMPITNLAKVFGPTIVGYSSPDIDQHAIYSETIIQFTVMERLLNVPTDYWSKYINDDYTIDYHANNTDIGKSYFNSPSLRNTTKKQRKFFATPPYPRK